MTVFWGSHMSGISKLAKSALSVIAAGGLFFSILQSQTEAQQPLPPPVPQQSSPGQPLPGQPSPGNLPPPTPQLQGQPFTPQQQGQPAGQPFDPSQPGGQPSDPSQLGQAPQQANPGAVPGTSRFAFVIGNDG